MTYSRNEQYMQRLSSQAMQRSARAGDVVRKRVVDLLDAPGTGEQYRGNPRPSAAPGEAPVTQTGELARSVLRYGAYPRPDGGVTGVGSYLKRAVMFEAGTATMAARPFLRPGLMSSRDNVLRAFGGAQ